MTHVAEKALNDDPMIKKRIRFADFSFRMTNGTDTWGVVVSGGEVKVAGGDSVSQPDFEIHIEPDAWTEMLKSYPRPGFHDLSSLVENRNARTTGNLLPLFTYLFVVKDIVSQIAVGRFI